MYGPIDLSGIYVYPRHRVALEVQQSKRIEYEYDD